MTELAATYNKNRAAARTMLVAEVGLAAAIALLLFLASGWVAARSALLGALIFVVPNALFAALAFKRPPGQGPGAMVRAAFLGEVVKLVVTLVLFAACFILAKPVNIGALLGVFGALIVFHAAGFAYLIRDDGNNHGS